eukprot:266915_1
MTDTQPKHEISCNLLKILIAGYCRTIQRELKNDGNDKIIPNSILLLFSQYYPTELYMMILNQKTLKLTLCHTSQNFVKQISSNVLNGSGSGSGSDELKELRVRGTEEVCIYHKKNIEINNLSKQISNGIDTGKKYNAIFRCGGSLENEIGSTKDCGVILYCTDLLEYPTKQKQNYYYYQLPPMPVTCT